MRFRGDLPRANDYLGMELPSFRQVLATHPVTWCSQPGHRTGQSCRRWHRDPPSRRKLRPMSDEPQGTSKLQVQIDEDVSQGCYCNLVLLNHTESEFILDFAFIQPAGGRAKVRARVISSPRHAKRLLAALQKNIERYEEKFPASSTCHRRTSRCSIDGRLSRRVGSRARRPGSRARRPGSRARRPGSRAPTPRGAAPRRPGSRARRPGAAPDAPGSRARRPGSRARRAGSREARAGSREARAGCATGIFVDTLDRDLPLHLCGLPYGRLGPPRSRAGSPAARSEMSDVAD